MKNRVQKYMKHTENGKHKGNGKLTANNESALQLVAPFSNYAGETPLGINEIYESLMALTDGWPKVISGTLCRRKEHEVRPLKTPAALFAWVRQLRNVDWKRGGGRAVPMEQF